MAKLYNLARMTTATTGTGTITLGSAVSGYLTFALAGVANGDVVDYAIKDGANSEHGTGTYTSSGTTLTRTVTKSTNANAAISLSGSAEVFISPLAETLNDASLITTGTFGAARIPTASDTAAGGIEIAVQSEMETATDVVRAVSPGRVQYHPGVAKAWCRFNGNGTVALNASYNVSSITDNGAGDYTVNFTTAFSSGNYSYAFTGRNEANAWIMTAHQSTAPATGSMRIVNPQAATDPTQVSAVFFGDQ